MQMQLMTCTVKQALVKSQTNPNQKITQDSPAYARGKRNKILLAYLKHSVRISKDILKNYSCC